MDMLSRFFRVGEWQAWVSVAVFVASMVGVAKLLGVEIRISSLIIGAVLSPICLLIFMLVSEATKP